MLLYPHDTVLYANENQKTSTFCIAFGAEHLFLLSKEQELQKQQAAAATDYRQEMRNFVIGISQYAKAQQPQFAIIPQNGIELITTNRESDGTLV